jgi:hypothetical protein
MVRIYMQTETEIWLQAYVGGGLRQAGGRAGRRGHQRYLRAAMYILRFSSFGGLLSIPASAISGALLRYVRPAQWSAAVEGRQVRPGPRGFEPFQTVPSRCEPMLSLEWLRPRRAMKMRGRGARPAPPGLTLSACGRKWAPASRSWWVISRRWSVGIRLARQDLVSNPVESDARPRPTACRAAEHRGGVDGRAILPDPAHPADRRRRDRLSYATTALGVQAGIPMGKLNSSPRTSASSAGPGRQGGVPLPWCLQTPRRYHFQSRRVVRWGQKGDATRTTIG